MKNNALAFADSAPRPLVDALANREAGLLERLLARHAGGLSDLRRAREDRQRSADDGALPRFAAGSVPGGAAAGPAEPAIELHAAPGAALAADAERLVVDLSAWLPATLAPCAAIEIGLERRNGDRGFEFGPRDLDTDVGCLTWRGDPVPAALLDLALIVPRRLATSIRLNRLESADEAAWWADVLDTAAGDDATLPVTFGIDSVHAAFAGGAMLDALGERATALCWDRHACLQSFVRTFRRHPRFILPDQAELTGAVHFLRCWGWRLVGLANARRMAAIAPCAGWLPAEGGIARALRADLERQVRDGYSCHAVSDAGLVVEAREIAGRLASAPDGGARGERPRITGADLLQVHKGKITERGMRRNLRAALLGHAALARGEAFVELDGQRMNGNGVGLAADQLWQWVHHVTGVLDDGRIIDPELFDGLLAEAGRAEEAAGVGAAADALRAHVLAAELPARFPSPAA